MHEEMNALEKNDTWELMNLLARKKLVGCKWCIPLSTRQMGLLLGTMRD